MPYPVYKIFISSTFEDLAPERKQVTQAISDLNTACGILGIGLVPIDLQRGAHIQAPLAVCLDEVKRSDLLVTLVGKAYGTICPNGLSYTEMEFDEATRSGIGRIAYYKDDAALFLPEHIENDSDKRKHLDDFRKKIDSCVKRDCFISPDDLRGHIIRDLTNWLLRNPEVASRTPISIASSTFSGAKDLFDAFASGNWQRAADLLSQPQLIRDMERFGLERLYHSLLRDLLELNRLAPPVRITDPRKRAKLLLHYARDDIDSFSTQVAIEQARALEPVIGEPAYSFEVSKIHVHSVLLSLA